MVKACILMKVVPVRLAKVLDTLKTVKGVVKCYPVYGRFDMVCFIEAKSNEEVANISAEINRIDGVRSTETLIEA
ncbi:MAG: Lrp/AsnC ligand binding domain-containing protein [Nitrososphaerota archaeon]|nr:Lrp/AsnC ligand binding domain-containing protein [Candidatus Bathyarchaeota archaeon]MCX8161808.1 Lrp/AsnC ligand binding domain-containing protein [Candidatus Bathyarchaeota archaeon]MDW8062066.1 Lrp/AsnC ligand binding domain-containing protein [Nitrososphaerota archaeon]